MATDVTTGASAVPAEYAKVAGSVTATTMVDAAARRRDRRLLTIISLESLAALPRYEHAMPTWFMPPDS